MKRLIAAVALGSLAFSASALEIGKPFEQLDLDRALPNIEFAPARDYVAGKNAPYEQLVIDRTLPNIEFAPVRDYVAGSNAPYEQLVIDRTLPNVSGHADTASTGSMQAAQSPWANDYSFIAPAL